MTPDEISNQLIRLASDHLPTYQSARSWFLERGAAHGDDLAAALDDAQLGSVAHWRILLLLRELRLASTLPAILKAFHSALASDNVIVLPGALEALAVFDDDDAWSALESALSSDDSDTANHAAALLAGKGGERAVRAIATLLNRPAAAFRQSAVSALKKVNAPQAREVLERHRQVERDPSVLKVYETSG